MRSLALFQTPGGVGRDLCGSHWGQGAGTRLCRCDPLLVLQESMSPAAPPRENRGKGLRVERPVASTIGYLWIGYLCGHL